MFVFAFCVLNRALTAVEVKMEARTGCSLPYQVSYQISISMFVKEQTTLHQEVIIFFMYLKANNLEVKDKCLCKIFYTICTQRLAQEYVRDG